MITLLEVQDVTGDAVRLGYASASRAVIAVLTVVDTSVRAEPYDVDVDYDATAWLDAGAAEDLGRALLRIASVLRDNERAEHLGQTIG